MGQRVPIGKISDLEDGEVTAVRAADQRLAVARIGDEVFALEDRCSHKECELSEGLVEDSVVICPCHGSEFDLASGEAMSLPAKEPVPRFATVMDGEEVYVEI